MSDMAVGSGFPRIIQSMALIAAYASFGALKAEFEDVLDQAGLMKTVHDFGIDLADYICSLTGTYFC